MRFLLLTCVLALTLSGAAQARTWYITPDGTGDAATIQAGIDSAAVGDTVLLGDGIYTGIGNRDIRYYGKAITVRSASGDPELCVIDCQATETDQHRGFCFDGGEDSSSVLEAVTVTGGYLTGWLGGGGIVCRISSPSITGCIVTGNHAKDGGGICCSGEGCPVITDCLVYGNSGVGGGGMFFGHSNATVVNVVCIGNSATAYGGGAYVHGPLNTLTGCTFADNSADVCGGGACCTAVASPIFQNCTFVNNSAPLGAGIGCIAYGPSHITLDRTIIAHNGEGEAVYCEEGECTMDLSCCDVYGNAGGDWVGCIAGQENMNGNFSADPRFCDPDNDDYRLYSGSTCAPGNHPHGYACGLIGAFDVACCVEAGAGPATGYAGVVSLPVEVSDVTDLGVHSAEIIIDYDPDILSPTGFDTTGTLIDGLGWFSGWAELEPGRTKVAMGGVTGLEGEGTLATLTFEVTDGAPCKGCTDLGLEIMLNEGVPCTDVTGCGRYCLPVETVTGTVRYYGCPDLGSANPGIPGVDLRVYKNHMPADSLAEAGVTDSLGDYTYAGCPDTCYTVALQKAPGDTIGITALDASLALQYTLGHTSLEACPIYPMLMPDSMTWCPEDTVYAQQVAADVSADGSISAYDVSLILKYAVGLNGDRCGEWRFYCDHRDYCPLDESRDDEDFVGLIMGDVSGDWKPAGDYTPGESVGHDLIVSDVTGVAGEVVDVPVYLDAAAEIVSLEFSVLHDLDLLSVESVDAVAVGADWQLAFNPLPGKTRIALAGAEPIGEAGEVVLIKYRVTSEPGICECNLEPVDIIADEGGTPVEGQGGVFSLGGASGQDPHQVGTFYSRIDPNPVMGGVEIRLGLPVEARVGITIYDAAGRLVRRPVSEEVFSAGEISVWWDGISRSGGAVSPGVYFVKVELADYEKTHRVVMLE